MSSTAFEKRRPLATLGQRTALAGLVLYVVFAPHSVAASAIGVGVAGIGWLLKVISTGSFGLRRTKFDLLIALLLLWTVASSLFSEEPRISLLKLQASWCVFLFYLTRAIVTKRSALGLVALLVLSGAAGALYSAFDLARGRGVLVQSLTAGSPFGRVGIQPGDTIWRIGRERVYSTEDIDTALKTLPANTPLVVSIFSQGENAERPGFVITPAQQQQPSPSGVTGGGRSHRFRASGWTRHYVTFAEMLQMIAQLALGFALAHLRNHGFNKYFKVAVVGAAILTFGIAFTAMRTVLIAFAIGATVIAWRSLRGAYKVAFTFALFFVLAFGAVAVWQTRAPDALLLGDPSSSLRGQVARVGLSRILIHPVFGHGMDAMKLHWNEWGFPGDEMIHLHSTPLQLAFDRGLPMLVLWLWLMIAFWLYIAGAEKAARDSSDTNSYGLLLGILGALTGFLASSLVNYNYGDAEAAMMFWWLMGLAVVLSRREPSVSQVKNRSGRGQAKRPPLPPQRGRGPFLTVLAMKTGQFERSRCFPCPFGCILEPCGDTHSGFHDPQAPSTNSPHSGASPMKRCPQCEFIYEDEQSLCDMDGVLLVFDSRTLPNPHALATLSAPLPGKTRRSRMAPAFATLILMLVIGSVYYVSTTRNAASSEYSPASTTAEAPSVVPPAPAAESIEPPVVEPTPEPTEAREAEPAARETQPAPATKPSAAPAAKPSAAPAKKSTTTTTKPVVAKPEEKKDDSKVGSILKKTGKILKKPFKF